VNEVAGAEAVREVDEDRGRGRSDRISLEARQERPNELLKGCRCQILIADEVNYVTGGGSSLLPVRFAFPWWGVIPTSTAATAGAAAGPAGPSAPARTASDGLPPRAATEPSGASPQPRLAVRRRPAKRRHNRRWALLGSRQPRLTTLLSALESRPVRLRERVDGGRVVVVDVLRLVRDLFAVGVEERQRLLAGLRLAGDAGAGEAAGLLPMRSSPSLVAALHAAGGGCTMIRSTHCFLTFNSWVRDAAFSLGGVALS
jgi:hypothetical protein